MTKPSNSEIENLAIGSLAGSIESSITHPLLMLKFHLQNGESFTLNPRILYRGLFLDVASNAPITAFQITLDRYIQKTFFPKNVEPSHKQKISSAFAAGFGSSLFIGPIEKVMTWQGKTGYALRDTTNYLVSEGGYRNLFTALPETSLRDGTSAACLLGAYPLIKRKLQAHCPNDYVASGASGAAAGLSATLLTQGIDTVKTVRQSSPPPILSSFKTVKQIKKEHGLYGFYKGTGPRALNAMLTMSILGFTIEKMENALTKHKAKKNR